VPDPLDMLKERLVRAGVRPSSASRYVAELRDHLDDLAAEEMAAGLDPVAARRRALARLGGVDDLAATMIADRRFQSRAATIPWAVFLLVPVLIQLAAVAATAFLLAAFTSPGAVPPWFGAAAMAARNAPGSVVPVLTAWAIAAIALRQRCRPAWSLLGIGTVACLGAMLHLAVTVPAAGRPGAIAVGVALPAAAHLLALLGLAAAPLLLVKAKARP